MTTISAPSNRHLPVMPLPMPSYAYRFEIRFNFTLFFFNSLHNFSLIKNRYPNSDSEPFSSLPDRCGIYNRGNLNNYGKNYYYIFKQK